MTIGRRLFDYDPVSGMTTWFEYDPITKTSILRYEQDDVEPELDLNAAMANDTDYSKRGIKRDWWHYAHIPDSVCMKMLCEHGISVWNPEHKAAVYKFINSPEYRKLKTTELFHRPSGHD